MNLPPLREFVLEEGIFVTAHRGSSGTAPENTLSAFRQAVRAGAKMVEIDVQMTSDNHIIAFHDPKLGRTAKGRQRTSKLTFDEIKSLDAGSWFSKDFAGEKVPSLKEVIAEIHGKAYLNIEIKSETGENSEDKLKEIIKVVYFTGYEAHTLFGSFDYPLLALLKELDPNLPTAAIRIPFDKYLPSDIAKETGCEAFVCSRKEISDKIAEDALKHNIFIGVYSIDKPKHLKKVMKYQIRTIVTNYPAKIIGLMEEMRTK